MNRARMLPVALLRTALVFAGTTIEATASSDAHVKKTLPCTSTLQSSGKGVVMDVCTHLMWQQNDNATPLTWYQAGPHCSALTLSGKHDWWRRSTKSSARSSATAR